MDLNSIIFPAPKSSFNYRKIDEVVWIPKKNKKPETQNLDIQKLEMTKISQDDGEKTEENLPPEDHCIPCLYLPYKHGSDKLLIYFHGNAEDIGWALEFCEALKVMFEVHVLAMEYPGYSLYLGEPSADEICKDGEIVFDYLTLEMGILPQNIFLFGRSIGSGPATYLAAHRDPGALFLMSPISSIRSVAKEIAGKIANIMVADRFRNIDEIKKVKCPSYFIHGKADTLVPYKHSVEMMNECMGISDMNLPEAMTHNDFALRDDIIEPILKFIKKCGIIIISEKQQYVFPSELYKRPKYTYQRKNKRSMLSKFYDKFIG